MAKKQLTKTVMSPITHFRNLMSNLMFDSFNKKNGKETCPTLKN